MQASCSLCVGKHAVKLPVKDASLHVSNCPCSASAVSEVICVCFLPVRSPFRAALRLGEDCGPPIWHLLRRVSKLLPVPDGTQRATAVNCGGFKRYSLLHAHIQSVFVFAEVRVKRLNSGLHVYLCESSGAVCAWLIRFFKNCYMRYSFHIFCN